MRWLPSDSFDGFLSDVRAETRREPQELVLLWCRMLPMKLSAVMQK